MLDLEEAATQKRKASPSPPAEDASKRVKLEGTSPQSTENVTYTDSGHVNNSRNRADADLDTEENSSNGHRSVLKQEQPDRRSAERRIDIPDVASSTNANDTKAASRLSAEARRPIAASASSRRNFSQEEKKRGQRLFGGLLSTLSQTTSNAQQKKRLEIERRQQERAHQQRAEDDKRRVEKLLKLDHARRIEQVQFDEQVMHTRHSNMLSLARSLSTESEPRIYYRPWQLTKDQEAMIEDQIRAAREEIDRETQEFMVRKEKRLRELGVPCPPSQPDTTVGEPKPPESTNASASSASRVPLDRDHDDNGDEMVQVDAEDTVLY